MIEDQGPVLLVLVVLIIGIVLIEAHLGTKAKLKEGSSASILEAVIKFLGGNSEKEKNK